MHYFILCDILITEKERRYELEAEITDAGIYTVKLTDKLGSTEEITFTVIKSVVSGFDEEIDIIPEFEKVIANGKKTAIEKGALVLSKSGSYEVSILAGGVTNTFTVTVDATAPTLTLKGVSNGGSTTKRVTITAISDGTLKVFHNDKEIEYKVGDELSNVGKYKAVLTDECRNTTEYTFEIQKGANVGIIILAVIPVLAIGGVGVFFYIKKKNSI